MNVAVEAVDELLPQTQCRQCGYAGCRPYAEAIAAGTAAINRCPPGGTEVIAELAALLGVAALPLDESSGTTAAPTVAVIDESACIGCTLCIAACPVDAIVGARRLMHTVLAAECTGCGLCLPPCPVDCIGLRPTGAPRDRQRQREMAGRLRLRHLARERRLALQSARRRAAVADAEIPAAVRKSAVLSRALARARARIAAKNRKGN
jgi:electron transport complex protein RnfB